MSIIWVFLESLEYWTLLGAWLELESEAHTIWAKLSVSCARNGSFFYLIILRLSGRAIKSQILCLYFSETGKWIKLGPNNSNSSHDHFRSHFPKLSHSSKNCHIHYHFFFVWTFPYYLYSLDQNKPQAGPPTRAQQKTIGWQSRGRIIHVTKMRS